MTHPTQDRSSDLPTHVGIIMDGNGRWAQEKGQPRSSGHREGLSSAKNIVSAAADRGIPFLTLYIFSTENWKRTKEEVSFLMRLIRQHLSREYAFYRKKGIRIVHSGDIAGLPSFVQSEIQTVTEQTAAFTGLTLNMAINYGGRDEIVRSLRRCLSEGKGPEITEEDITAHLDIPFLPEPDLIIRSAGEVRLSNFLTWQSVYAEIYISSKLWPDWDETDLDAAIDAYQIRKRKFGGVT